MARGATGQAIWQLLSGVAFAAVIGVGFAIPILAASGAFSVPAGPGNPDTSGPDGDLAAATSDQESITAFVTVADSIDSDGDGILDALDNCPSVYNPDQTNTDADLSASGATIGGVPIGDALGDACDDDDDDDGTRDTIEGYVGTYPLDNCGTDAWPPDSDDNGAGNGYIDNVDFLIIVQSWLTADPDPGYIKRADMFDANGIVDNIDFVPTIIFWLKECT